MSVDEPHTVAVHFNWPTGIDRLRGGGWLHWSTGIDRELLSGGLRRARARWKDKDQKSGPNGEDNPWEGQFSHVPNLPSGDKASILHAPVNGTSRILCRIGA